jgi:penicillin-binding protein 1A
VNPVPVISIVDAAGSPVWQASPKPKQVVDPAVAAAANAILQKVVLYGTGTAANIGRPQIGKTGTNQNYADAWFVGAVPQLVAGRLGGFPQGQISMYGGFTRSRCSAARGPRRSGVCSWRKAVVDLPVREFPRPT